MHYFFLFFSNLLRYHASACSEIIFNPSSGGRVYYVANGTCFSSESTVGGLGLRRKNSASCWFIIQKSVDVFGSHLA
jgi:hypothetical protein